MRPNEGFCPWPALAVIRSEVCWPLGRGDPCMTMGLQASLKSVHLDSPLETFFYKTMSSAVCTILYILYM